MKEDEILDQEIKLRNPRAWLVALIIIWVCFELVSELWKGYHTGLSFTSLKLIPCVLIVLFFSWKAYNVLRES